MLARGAIEFIHLTADASSHSRGVFRPSFASFVTPSRKKGRREDRAPAGTHDGPRAEHCARNAQERHRAAETTRPSLRGGFTAYAALSPETNSSLSPSPRELAMHRNPVGSMHLREGLTVATTAR